MRVIERCTCGAQVEADDQPVTVGDRVDRGSRRYSDGSGIGYAPDFVKEWRTSHYCPAKAERGTTGGEG